MKPLVGASACLLGEEVRWDGGHRSDLYVRETLARYFQFVPVCPEVEVGMGVPREPVHLAGALGAPRMVGNHSGEDWSDRMHGYCRRRAGELTRLGLCGCILKHGSPSCGMERVAVTNRKGIPHENGRGLFAAELARRLPHLPVEEEGRLHEAGRRENFVMRVFALHRARQVLAGRFSRGQAVAFHTREKLLLMAHSPGRCRRLGRLVAAIKDHTPADFRDRYLALFMQALQQPATVRRNLDVMQQVLGRLDPRLSLPQKQVILAEIDRYRRELAPPSVPLTLLVHYLRLHGVDDLLEQTYLQPAPEELALRNRV